MKPKILLVDDKFANIITLKTTLSGVDAELITAFSGENALEKLIDHDNFILAILDVNMPIMDGYELAKLMRGDPNTRRIPIIFLTAESTQSEHKIKGIKSGAFLYIVKPYDPNELVKKVNKFIGLYNTFQLPNLKDEHDK